MSVNLSKQNFKAANSRRNGLYFSSEDDVCFDAYPNGCSHMTFFPPGRIVVIFCESTPANMSFEPSVVSMNGVPSNCSACRTGSDTSLLFRSRNALVCSGLQMSVSL